jgi:hypothetical protein
MTELNMKIGRNDPCFCGSGKKFKRCCINKYNTDYQNKQNKTIVSKKNTFFEKYNSFDLLQTFAGLSLVSENHGKNVRLELLALSTLQNFNTKTVKVSREDLGNFLEKKYSSNHAEELPVNLFTDLVTFYGGDYLIFPGITENSSFLLTNLLAAIFHWPNSNIRKEVKVNCRNAISFILALSDTIALRLGYIRYQEGTSTQKLIFIPSEIRLDKLKTSVIFSSNDINQLCQDHVVSKEVINEFLINLNSTDFHSEHVEESPLILTPLIKIDDKVLVASPSTLSLALTDFIWREAEKWGCMREMNDAYHNVLWNNLQMQLGQLQFSRLGCDLFPEVDNSKFIEGLFKFDDDKIAYIQYIGDRGENYKRDTKLKVNKIVKPDDFQNHKTEIISKLLSKAEFQNFGILDFTILAPIGRDFYYPIRPIDNTRTLAVPIFELDVLFNLKDISAIDLWKFAIARAEQLKGVSLVSLSFLDQYKIYKDHNESFHLSDDSRYNFVHIQPGYSADLIWESKTLSDKHSVLKSINGKLANVQVEKKDKYAPIYIDITGLSNGELEFLLDGFHQAIWVTPKPILTGCGKELRHMYWEFNDAIAYWLWQIQNDIKDVLKLIGDEPITVSFDFIQRDKFEYLERNFAREKNLLGKFQTTATSSSIDILIPPEINPYLYGTDNEGERILVHSLLNAINKLLLENSKEEITKEGIDLIIDRNVPLGMKKKIFILDTNDNLLLDPRNIGKYRYVQEYDTSIVLNEIVPRLGALCPPVGEVVTQKERDDLAFKIVQNALFPLLREKISKYDSTSLLKRLLGLNESLIKKREDLRINTPMRIACFVSIEQHQIDLKESLANVNRTTIAVRSLIEHLAAEPGKGSRIVSTTGIDELVAIMDQIISWGSLSDQIHYNLFDIKMGVLPSGRIGTEKSTIREIFDPYYESKTKEDVIDAISTFNSVFPQNENIEYSDVPDNLNTAFVADFGISFSRICEFIDRLAQIGFLQTTAYASLQLSKLYEAINENVLDFDGGEFQRAISYLALKNRGKVDILPKGYDFIDIMPWRFSRMLSLLRKPLILVDSDNANDSPIAYWGPRQILQSKITLADQCQSDRLRVFEGSEVQKVLGKFANKRGKKLVNKIVSLINSVGLIIDTDVYIGPNHSLKNNIEIGDIDVLVIDPTNRIFLSLECKSMSPSRNIKEMVEEVAKLFGSNSEMGWIDKHVRRHEWVEANRDQISTKYKIDISDFKIKSFFITNEDMLTPYLRKQILKIPFITSYEIEQEGYDILVK